MQKNFHIQLSAWYENLAIRSSGEVKLMLDYIVHHQRENVATLVSVLINQASEKQR